MSKIKPKLQIVLLTKQSFYTPFMNVVNRIQSSGSVFKHTAFIRSSNGLFVRRTKPKLLKSLLIMQLFYMAFMIQSGASVFEQTADIRSLNSFLRAKQNLNYGKTYLLYSHSIWLLGMLLIGYKVEQAHLSKQ